MAALIKYSTNGKGKLNKVDVLQELAQGKVPTEIAKAHSVDPSAVTRKVKRLTGLNPTQYRSKLMFEEFEAGTSQVELSSKYNISLKAVADHINKGGRY